MMKKQQEDERTDENTVKEESTKAIDRQETNMVANAVYANSTNEQTGTNLQTKIVTSVPTVLSRPAPSRPVRLSFKHMSRLLSSGER